MDARRRLLVGVAVLCVVFGCAVSQTFQPICAGPGHYDVTNLTQVQYWTVTADKECPAGAASCTFNISFCHPLPNHDDCQGSSVCITTYNGTEKQSMSLGKYDHDPFTLRDQGFEALFEDGSIYGKNCSISSVIIFECDKNVPWIASTDGSVSEAPQPTSIAFNFAYCTYNIVFAYAGACYTPIVTPTQPPTFQPVCAGPGSYDVSTLTKVQYWTVTADKECPGGAASCTFNISFCKPLPNHDECQGSSVCISYFDTQQQSVSLGKYEHDPFALRDKGFEAIFGDGSPYGKNCNMSSIIVFECDETQHWMPAIGGGVSRAPQPISIAFNFAYCEYNIVFGFDKACDAIDTGLSAGTVLIILFFTLLPAYFLIGIVYNGVNGRSGKDMVPQNEFWTALPTFIVEGFVFCFTCGSASGRTGPSSASGKEYENI